MLEKYYHINQAVGVSIHLLADGSIDINACQIILAGNLLNIDKKVIGMENVESLKKHFASKSNVALNLSGKGILQKQIDALHDINQHKFSKVLPNAKIEDFYVQNFVSGAQSFVSVVRKSEADKWIGHLHAIGLIPLQMSIGPFPVHNIIPQLNVYDSGLIFNGHIIEFKARSEWGTYKYDETALSPFPLKVESESLDEKLLIPYATAFNLVMASRVQSIKAHVPYLETEFTKLIAAKKLKVMGVLILTVFFILLLINFVLFSWLNGANNRLTEQVGQLAQSSMNSQGIEDQAKQKEALLNDLGWDEGINKSALADQLAALLPAEITLNEIAVNPIDLAASRSQKSLSFAKREIKITGNSEKITPVNEWIARAKTKSWVKNIQLDSYTFNSELSTGQFTIIINY